MAVTLLPHQSEAVEKLSNGKILWGGVGTGKSIAAVAYYEEYEAPKDVYVITTARKRDDVEWEGEFAKFGIGKSADSTLCGILTVDSWNNIGKYADVEGAFFIFDEQRLVGAGHWTDKFLKIAKKNHWILLTATPGDNWLDYIPVFIANGFFKNRTEFKREHVTYSTYTKFPKVERYRNVGKLVRLRNHLLVEMPYVRKTVRHSENVQVVYDGDLFYTVTEKRWNPYEGRPIRDIAEMFMLMRRVVNSDASRVKAVEQLLTRHPRLIVFYNFDYELDALRTLGRLATTSAESAGASSSNENNEAVLPAEEPGRKKSSKQEAQCTESPARFAMAEWNGHKHQPVPTTDRWLYLVQYTAGAEAWNCVATDAICFYSLNYSYKTTEQAMGRIDRLNTPFKHLWYYFLTTNSMIDRAIQRSLAEKEDFNETAYLRKKKV